MSCNTCKSFCLCKYDCKFTPDKPVIPTPVPIKINTPRPNEMKALGLFEYEILELDRYLVDSIYFCWYQDPSLPRFPIVYTDGTVKKNIELLNHYYKLGYRYFIGFSRSTIASGVLAWFIKHPDAKGISITSGASSLAIPKNIYRMVPFLGTLLTPLFDQIQNASTIYYIYNKNELVSLDLLKILELDPNTKNKLKSYPIIDDSSYNVNDLNNFFTGAMSNDIVLLGIFQPDTYANLYNNGLSFPGDQFTVVGVALNLENLIEPSASILNKKYFYIDNIYPNTSLLFRENKFYIQKKYGPEADPGNIANALKMIQYFIENKDIDNLASYSGTLEFDENNDLKYPSFLVQEYVKIGPVKTFKKSYLTFNDPLLGRFNATFT